MDKSVPSTKRHIISSCKNIFFLEINLFINKKMTDLSSFEKKMVIINDQNGLNWKLFTDLYSYLSFLVMSTLKDKINEWKKKVAYIYVWT